jgi:hypothetical protein
VQNFVGNFAGAIAPMLTGYIVGRTGQFYWAFAISAAVAWLGAVSWVFGVGPIIPVDWEKKLNRPDFRINVAPVAGAARP